MRSWLSRPSADFRKARPPGRRPRRPWIRALVFGAGVTAAAAASVPAASAQPARPRTPGGALKLMQGAVPVTPMWDTRSATVTLATGDRVTVSSPPGGRPSYIVRPAPGSRGAADSYQGTGGDHYVVPAAAIPYLGTELDRSLFDVSALVRDGITGGARVPVSLGFAPGTPPAAPPGVTLTSVSGSSAQGYLTPASTNSFAAALRRGIAAGMTAGRLARPAQLFPGLTAMSLAAPGAPAQPRPYYPLHILQINATDATGQPAFNNAIVGLINTDDAARENTIVPVNGGVGRIAVPAGDYSIVTVFVDFDSQGFPSTARVVTLADFAVPGTAGTTTVTLDERTATSAISAATPRPAAQDGMTASVYRMDAAGHGAFLIQVAGSVGPAYPLYVNAQPAAAVGRLHYVVQWGGAGPAPAPPSTAGAYRYDVAFGSDDIPADESFTVRSDQIATVRHHFSADPGSGGTTGLLFNAPSDPVSATFPVFEESSLNGDTMPGDLTEYLGTADSGQWAQAVQTPNGTFLAADTHTFAARGGYSLAWAHGPLAAVMGQHTGAQFCVACAAGSTLSIGFDPAGDSEPDHAEPFFAVYPDPSRYHFTLYRDGTQLFDGRGDFGVTVPGIPAVPASYRAVFDEDLTGIPGISQSTRARTDLTVPYSPVPVAGSALPAEDFCDGQSASVPCEILPALTLNYQMVTDEDNTSGSPVQVLGLRVGHLSYDGAGSHARVTSASVSVSFDGGASWQPVTVTGTDGYYAAFWANPPSALGTDPELRVTATDAIGGSITQTIANAYTISSSTASSTASSAGSARADGSAR